MLTAKAMYLINGDKLDYKKWLACKKYGLDDEAIALYAAGYNHGRVMSFEEARRGYRCDRINHKNDKEYAYLIEKPFGEDYNYIIIRDKKYYDRWIGFKTISGDDYMDNYYYYENEQVIDGKIYQICTGTLREMLKNSQWVERLTVIQAIKINGDIQDYTDYAGQMFIY